MTFIRYESCHGDIMEFYSFGYVTDITTLITANDIKCKCALIKDEKSGGFFLSQCTDLNEHD